MLQSVFLRPVDRSYMDRIVRPGRLQLYRQAQQDAQKKSSQNIIEKVSICPGSYTPSTHFIDSDLNNANDNVIYATILCTDEDKQTKSPSDIKSSTKLRHIRQRLASKQEVSVIDYNSNNNNLSMEPLPIKDMHLDKNDKDETTQQFLVDDGVSMGSWIKKLSLTEDGENRQHDQSTIYSLQRSTSEPKLSSFALRALNKSMRDGLVTIENRKRLQATRQLFMELERRQAKESTQIKKEQKTMNRLKELKENERLHQEQLLAQEIKGNSEETKYIENTTVIDVNSTDPVVLQKISKQRSREQKRKELERYILALKTSLKNRCLNLDIDVPCMCSCFESIWEADPFKCANNCAFYRNPAAFATSLHSLLNSCQAK
ncbi:unnamed protein product [Didymodactylos carnosus]|uniref:Uncharacterized protein n=1 Tax=Didymodactylos carnosus TaxID=1234261 RepID=A0A813ZT54_9BILA|nr:unnamed protein product [Didymodactylos carnosus]CAF3685737.1 unnamed protein product [Didymodactylos carnosus]